MAIFFILIGYLYILMFFEKQFNTYNNRQIRFLMLIFAAIPMIIIAGFRAESVGMDTPMYTRVFYNISNYASLNLYEERFEIGFKFLNLLIGSITNNPNILFLLCSIITIGLIFKFYSKKSAYPLLSIIFFVQFLSYYSTMNVMRQYIAVSIGTIAYKYAEKRNFVKFLSIVLLATTFHTSAYVLLLLYFLPLMKISKKNTRIILTSGLIMFILLNPLLKIILTIFPRYFSFLSSQYFTTFDLGSIINMFIAFCFFIVKYLTCSEDTKQEDTIYQTNWNRIEYYVSLFGFLIILLSIRGAIIARFYKYFEICNYIILVNSLKSIKNKGLKLILIYLVIILSLIYNFIIFKFRPEWSGVVPYLFNF